MSRLPSQSVPWKSKACNHVNPKDGIKVLVDADSGSAIAAKEIICLACLVNQQCIY